jgi:hypothetical protein
VDHNHKKEKIFVGLKMRYIEVYLEKGLFLRITSTNNEIFDPSVTVLYLLPHIGSLGKKLFFSYQI